MYPTLLKQQTYYDANRKHPSTLYTDHAIYSPGVVFFKLRGRDEVLEEPFLVCVITAPAPNTAPMRKKYGDAALPEVRECFHRRWGNVLAIAERAGNRTLLLGAWGCGAFGGDPQMAAKTVRDWLDGPRFQGAFDQLVFAIPASGGQSQRNHTAFRGVLTR